ncbi:MAG: alpha-glucosidase [Oscillospiraceae bacterium]|nr:alpha-glucosidase [Oscillospiraceae bacterium]
MEKKCWYKEMAVYQIWCRSFCDGNGDGIGDLWGVLSKLDYIASLNVDGIWFSPLYPSPNADYGYDISDYKNIHPDFGNLEVFKQVLDGAHERGMRVFMDLVVNHSSDEHEWFKESRKSRDNPYRDYYYWRPGKGKKGPPNNWDSLFEGRAWEYDKSTDEWYMHIFSKKQPDLNMANPKVREEVKDIMRFWLDMGVDGFREDVITYIAKADGLPSAKVKLPAATGMQYYTNLPKVHDYLAEFKHDVLDFYDCFTVGEGPRMEPEVALSYVREGKDKVLDMMINFAHMEADCFITDFLQRPFNLIKLKKAFTKWQTQMYGKGWNALYMENHDHPRIISRYGSEKYRVESGKSIAASYLFQRGTPFVYQGQEIGMVNTPLDSLDKYKDIMVKNNARIARSFGLSKETVLKLAQKASRDNARTCMQWADAPNAGFTSGKPWFVINGNYKDINVESQLDDPNSILNFYRDALQFRRDNPVVIYGDYVEHLPKSKELYVYERNLAGKKLLVVCSYSEKCVRFDAPEGITLDETKQVFGNYDSNFVISNGFTTRPYEMRVYLF